MSGAIDKIRGILINRKNSYLEVFAGEGAPKVVLGDLARFCHAQQSTFHPDNKAEGVLQGRREVWLYIQRQLKLTEDELFDLLQQNKLQG